MKLRTGCWCTRWSTSTITFYKPERLKSPDLPALRSAVAKDPEQFWDRLLDEVVSSGAPAVELSIPPGDWETARRAYGGAAGARRALRKRGLGLSSSYMTGHPLTDAVRDPRAAAEMAALVADHASFIAELGGDLILQGPAKRPLTKDGPSPDVDPDFRAAVAHLTETLARVARAAGTRYAIHTEAYSIVARDNDVRSMLELTDPDLVLLCPDAGHITLDGGDAIAVLREHAARVPIAHWKDCSAPVAGDTTEGHIRHNRMVGSFRCVGEGIVDWQSFADVFVTGDKPRWAVAEIDFSDDPVADVAKVLAFGARVIARAMTSHA